MIHTSVSIATIARISLTSEASGLPVAVALVNNCRTLFRAWEILFFELDALEMTSEGGNSTPSSSFNKAGVSTNTIESTGGE